MKVEEFFLIKIGFFIVVKQFSILNCSSLYMYLLFIFLTEITSSFLKTVYFNLDCISWKIQSKDDQQIFGEALTMYQFIKNKWICVFFSKQVCFYKLLVLWFFSVQ